LDLRLFLSSSNDFYIFWISALEILKKGLKSLYFNLFIFIINLLYINVL